MFGYCLLNAAISRAARSLSGVQLHQLMLPLVAGAVHRSRWPATGAPGQRRGDQGAAGNGGRAARRTCLENLIVFRPSDGRGPSGHVHGAVSRGAYGRVRQQSNSCERKWVRACRGSTADPRDRVETESGRPDLRALRPPVPAATSGDGRGPVRGQVALQDDGRRTERGRLGADRSEPHGDRMQLPHEPGAVDPVLRRARNTSSTPAKPGPASTTRSRSSVLTRSPIADAKYPAAVSST